MWEKQKVTYFKEVLKAARRLRNRHGEVIAHKPVAYELRKAKRGRCRKRFGFWESVAAELSEVTGRKYSDWRVVRILPGSFGRSPAEPTRYRLIRWRFLFGRASTSRDRAARAVIRGFGVLGRCAA